LTTLGAATAAVVASAAPLRNLRRVAADEDLLGIYSLPGSDLTDDMVRLSRLTRPNGSYSSKAGSMECILYGVLSPRTRHELSRPHAARNPRGRTYEMGLKSGVADHTRGIRPLPRALVLKSSMAADHRLGSPPP